MMDKGTYAKWAARVAPVESCWIWNGRTDKDGYGLLWANGHHRRAHRLAYEHFVGPIPEGLVMDHLCRVPACVNPSHLEPVTVRENNLRGYSFAGNQARQTHCIHGHEFTEENTLVGSGQRSCRECSRIKARRRYWALKDLVS